MFSGSLKSNRPTYRILGSSALILIGLPCGTAVGTAVGVAGGSIDALGDSVGSIFPSICFVGSGSLVIVTAGDGSRVFGEILVSLDIRQAEAKATVKRYQIVLLRMPQSYQRNAGALPFASIGMQSVQLTICLAQQSAIAIMVTRGLMRTVVVKTLASQTTDQCIMV